MRLLAVAVVLLVLGCTRPAQEKPIVPIRQDFPLLESVSRPANGLPAGYRLWPDGRYEEMGPKDPPAGTWVLMDTYTAADLDRFHAAAAKVDLSGLKDSYQGPPARDATVKHLRLQSPAGTREIDVVSTRVPEVEALEAAMVAARQR